MVIRCFGFALQTGPAERLRWMGAHSVPQVSGQRLAGTNPANDSCERGEATPSSRGSTEGVKSCSGRGRERPAVEQYKGPWGRASSPPGAQGRGRTAGSRQHRWPPSSLRSATRTQDGARTVRGAVCPPRAEVTPSVLYGGLCLSLRAPRLCLRRTGNGRQAAVAERAPGVPSAR